MVIRVGWIAVVACVAGCSTSSSEPARPRDDASTCGFGCDGAPTPEELDASLGVRVRARLELCNGVEGCHVSGVAGLHFPPGDELADLIEVRATERPELFRVKRGDPGASYLYLKVLGDGGIDGAPMPLTSAAYDPRIPATIAAWIEAGAP